MASLAFSISSRASPAVHGGGAAGRAFLRFRSAVPSLGRIRNSGRRLAIRCQSSPLDSSPERGAAVLEKRSVDAKKGKWAWKYEDQIVNVYYEEHGGEVVENTRTILMIPTISDVSTVEEWREVASAIVSCRGGRATWRSIIVDWPGLGYSDRPSLNYTADVMENFLVSFLTSPTSPLSNSGGELVIVGGGHAATIAVRAAKKGLVKPSAVAAVAPTWAGPLPIVFGRSSDMESRYGFLRGTLRAPAVGWMMYSMLVSNEKAIQSQYTSHVYANARNVTPEVVQSRFELTKREGARFVPAAFLTGELDPVGSRDEFVALFKDLQVPVLVVGAAGAPKRSKAEMDALRGASGVTKFVEVPGALLPHEEYPQAVAEELFQFLEEAFST
ncbi:alpha/beta-Hydrolases superfamily protein [Wolffia australiana]